MVKIPELLGIFIDVEDDTVTTSVRRVGTEMLQLNFDIPLKKIFVKLSLLL